MRRLGFASLLLAAIVGPLLSAACGGEDGEQLTIYSGRTEELVKPILDRFADETGIDIQVRYGDTAELASAILEEGDNSPADVYFAQDAGALGALVAEGRLAKLPDSILERVGPGFRARGGEWVGISGRARVVVYNTTKLAPEDLPDTIDGFTDERWRGRIGWAPTNGSFQSFVTAYRVLKGDDAAEAWLRGIQANDPTVYPNNAAAVEGVARGEVDVAFVNHYYLFRFLAEEGDDFPARNHFLSGGDPGALINVAGVGILESSDNKEAAQQFIEFMLSDEAQQYFSDETYEYPLVEGVKPNEDLPPLESIGHPDIDLNALEDLQGTQRLLQETGVLP